ncbi:transcription elongation factor SPT6 [Leptidea sinapis]|uniref:transcription elongation factor SPT6 n=1 Tax=Leptidea sinapis TaxID=189913 RepID=UPI00212F53B4|nr:transcription elongation factor SPT6 [Leptidea sinapis]
MADFLESEAEESEVDSEEDEQPASKKPKRKAAVQSDDEDDEEEDDEERLREELKDLIDDAPIEESGSDGEDSDASAGPKKRKKSDDELDDRLEDEDYDLIEENLGVKVARNKFKRLRRLEDDDSDNEGVDDPDLEREVIAEKLFVGGSDEEDENRSESAAPREAEYDDENEDLESDADDFIVDDDGRPIAERKKKRKPIFTDASLQEGQDIFGVDFDYDEFEKYGEEDYEDEEEEDLDEYIEDEEEDGDRRRTKKGKAKRPSKKSIFEIYEPSELKRSHFTDLDNEIRKTDIPERMQIREVPITPVEEGSSELEDEAEWIYKQAFLKPPVSKADAQEARERSRRTGSTVIKIRQALDFMRNQTLEVPFIAFYRKEYVQPELSINDLWKVYKYDAKWCQLKQRKENLIKLFENMREYQLDKVMENPDAPIPDTMRLIKDEDIDRLKSVQTSEELRDVHTHFLLYYSHDLPEMQKLQRVKERKKEIEEKKRQAREEAERNGEDPEEAAAAVQASLPDEEEPTEVKYAVRSGPYELCRKAGLEPLVRKFGLTAEQFAENVRDNYQRHEVEQAPVPPLEAAQEYTARSAGCSAAEAVRRAVYMCGVQLAREPLLRSTLRDALRERATVSVWPTPRGLKEIDESHACFSMKYLKKKPVRDLTGDQFLKLSIAAEDKLLELSISENIEGNTGPSYLEELKQLYQKDEFAATVQAWNDLRAEAVTLALTKIVMPELRRELQALLLQESKEYVLKCCRRRLYDWLKVAPYESRVSDDDDEEWDASNGIRVVSIAYVPDRAHCAFACAVVGGGEVTDHLRLPHLLYRRNAFDALERENKEADLTALRRFILRKKPHVIVIGGESREALNIKADVSECVQQLIEDEQFPRIPIEIADNHISKIYSNSIRGRNDFREYPDILRQAICQARLIQDPLMEISQLCGPDEEILCLRYHPLQDQITKEDLLEGIELEFVNRVNEVGVDVNEAVLTGRGTELLQFVCGLGPRKAQALLKLFKQTNQKLENRTQLVTVCHMGPKVFINCSGFIKIDTSSLGDSTEAYIEVLDGSRVHPETYEWARKMAVDALEYEDEDANPAGALEEILEAPERLKDLDLDAFAEELERQGFGNKSITLYDIRAELNSRYKDLRVSYRSPTHEEMFDILTKESPDSFFVGKMVLATVVGISHRKPQREMLDQANPVRNDETGLWECPFCRKNDFPELSEVWNHFDAGACPGQATGVRVRLDNGLSGYIHIKNLSDRHVTDPTERVRIGQTIHCRVLKIDVERFSVDCSSKSSDLLDKNNEWRPPKDPYYDQESEDKDIRKDKVAKQTKERAQYVKRVIVHPSFHNISFAEAEKLMESMAQGEVIIRPSSKGSDHLTVTWKVAEGICQHIDVREEGKENAFSLGRSLWIQGSEFEDLDEIIARYVTPMAGHARDLIAYKYYKPLGGMRDKAEEWLKEEKAKNANKIHYIISAAKNHPGRFLLSYLPRNKVTHEYVSVTPDGYKFRQRMFDSLGGLLKWFKEHFRDPPPSGTPVQRTPALRTPHGGMTSTMYHTPAPHTPAFHTPAHTPGPAYINTPYTPSAQTPYMTPFATTPRQPDFLTPVVPRHKQVPVYTEPSDWQKAAEDWVRHRTVRDTPATPRSSEGMSTPRQSNRTPRHDMRSTPRHDRTPRHDDRTPRHDDRTPRYDDRTPRHDDRTPRHDDRTPRHDDRTPRHDSRTPRHDSRTPRHDGRGSRSHSVRSTPHTNTSPRSMSLGDATPLYDEN